MSNKSSIHDLYSRYYGNQKKTRGVKKGYIRGKYKSHMKKLTLDEKREKNRLYQRKYRKKKKMSADSLNCKDFLKTGGTLPPDSEVNAHVSRQQRSITAETQGPHGISLITRMSRHSKNEEEVRSSQ